MRFLGTQPTPDSIATVLSAFPSKTVAELGSTYLASDHYPGIAFCLDSTPPVPVYSYAGQWLMVGVNTVVSTDPATPADTTPRRGVNLSGMEYSQTVIPGAAGTNYFLPTLASFQYWAAQGMNIVRQPIYLGRWFDTPGGALNSTGMAHLDLMQSFADATGVPILLDGHDYASRYINGATVTLGSTAYPISAWASDWAKVAAYIKGKSAFWGIDFVNEPQNLAILSSEFNYMARPFVQLMRDPQFRNPTPSLNWYTTDPYTVANTGGTNGGGCISWNSTSGAYKDAVRHLDGSGNSGGDTLVAGQTYTVSINYTSTATSGTHFLYFAAGDYASGSGVALGSIALVATGGVITPASVTFKMPAGQTGLYYNFNMQGFVGTGQAQDFNITVGSTLQTFVPWSSDGGPLATISTAQNSAIAAVRGVGYDGWLLWEGDRSSGLSSFGDNYGFFPDIPWVDPLNRTQWTVHYYQDPDYSGTYTAQWTQATRDRLAGQMAILGANSAAKGYTVFMGESGVPSDTSASSVNYRTDYDTMLTLADGYSFNGTYWAASDNGNDFSSITDISPINGVDNATVLPIVKAHDWTHVGNVYPADAVTRNGSALTYNGTTITRDTGTPPVYPTTPANAVTYNGATLTDNGTTITRN